MHGNVLKNFAPPPRNVSSAVTASPTPGVLPLRISRTTTGAPPMITFGEICTVPDLGLAGAPITTAHGGLAVDKYATGTLGHVLLWHRRVFMAVDFIARTRRSARHRRGHRWAP